MKSYKTPTQLKKLVTHRQMVVSGNDLISSYEMLSLSQENLMKKRSSGIVERRKRMEKIKDDERKLKEKEQRLQELKEKEKQYSYLEVSSDAPSDFNNTKIENDEGESLSSMIDKIEEEQKEAEKMDQLVEQHKYGNEFEKIIQILQKTRGSSSLNHQEEG